MDITSLDKDCVIRDIKDYYGGIISKKNICKHLSNHLNIIAMPLSSFILMIVSICLIAYFIARI